MTNKKRLYRSREGVIFGVCRGIADYYDIPIAKVRIAAIILILITGLWPLSGIYILLAVVLQPAPVHPITNDSEQEFYNSVTTSRKLAIERLRKMYDRINRRIANIEKHVTSKEYDWEQRLNDDS